MNNSTEKKQQESSVNDKQHILDYNNTGTSQIKPSVSSQGNLPDLSLEKLAVNLPVARGSIQEGHPQTQQATASLQTGTHAGHRLQEEYGSILASSSPVPVQLKSSASLQENKYVVLQRKEQNATISEYAELPSSVRNLIELDPSALYELDEPITRPRTSEVSFFINLREYCLEFITYAKISDLWSAIYNIIFIIVASLWLGRLPKMPISFLVFIPFVYLSVLGSGLLFLGSIREKYIGRPQNKILYKILGPRSFLAGYFRRDGERLLRTAFGVGIFLFIGVFYRATNSEQFLPWLLLPLLLLGMLAIFSLNQKLNDEDSDKITQQNFRQILIRRFIYTLTLLISIYAMYRLFLHNMLDVVLRN